MGSRVKKKQVVPKLEGPPRFDLGGPFPLIACLKPYSHKKASHTYGTNKAFRVYWSCRSQFGSINGTRGLALETRAAAETPVALAIADRTSTVGFAFRFSRDQ